MSRTRKAVFAVALTVMLAALVFIVIYVVKQHEANEIYDELRSKVAVPHELAPVQPKPADTAEQGAVTERDTTESDTPEPDTTEPVEPYVSPLDFDVIREPNEDIYAWLDIPGTDIAYPVVQHPTDDVYYLEHTIEGKHRLPGSIYTERWNSRDFSDFLTVVYGHCMKNGTMFGSLRKFKSRTYMEEHPTVSFYTTEGEYHYKIFAAVTYPDAYLPNAFDYSTETGRQAFIDSIVNNPKLKGYVNTEIAVTPEDRFVALSTCVGNYSYRLLVIGVLDKDISTK